MAELDELKRWLDDAYSMELSISEALRTQAIALQNYPELYEHIFLHLQQTDSHLEDVRRLLGSLGGETSGAKALISDLLGRIGSAATGIYRDHILKNLLLNHAIEHFEIACYTSIVAAAESLGLTDVAQTCKKIIADEEKMARWVMAQIPRTTRFYLARQEPS